MKDEQNAKQHSRIRIPEFMPGDFPVPDSVKQRLAAILTAKELTARKAGRAIQETK